MMIARLFYWILMPTIAGIAALYWGGKALLKQLSPWLEQKRRERMGVANAKRLGYESKEMCIGCSKHVDNHKEAIFDKKIKKWIHKGCYLSLIGESPLEIENTTQTGDELAVARKVRSQICTEDQRLAAMIEGEKLLNVAKYSLESTFEMDLNESHSTALLYASDMLLAAREGREPKLLLLFGQHHIEKILCKIQLELKERIERQQDLPRKPQPKGSLRP